MTPHAFRALLCACLLPTGALAAESLIFNGRFELGPAGYDRVRSARFDRNPPERAAGARRTSSDRSVPGARRFYRIRAIPAP